MSAAKSRSWQDRLFHASRSQSFLWKFALTTLCLGAVVGYVVSRVHPPQPHLLGDRVLGSAGLAEQDDEVEFREAPQTAPNLLPTLVEELRSPDLNFAYILRAIPALAPFLARGDHARFGEILRTRFSADDSAFAVDYLESWNPANSDAFTRLQARADQPSPTRYVRYAVGRIFYQRKNYPAAYERFRQEAETEGANESRAMAVYTLAKAKNFKALEALGKDERFAPFFDPYTRREIAVGLRDWSGLLKWIVVTQVESYQDPVYLVALVAGLAWAFFLFNFGEVPRFWSVTSALCLAGFVAGIISTVPTVFISIIEEDVLQFSKGFDPYHMFAYNIAGVGTREELCKLLVFLPLLPFLLKRGDDLEALLVASFVGLGFAIEENGGYFMHSAAASAPGRFLTANFFHIALTGLNGLALFRACLYGVRGLNELMVILPVTILVHGAYDALLDLTEVDGASYIAMILYVGFAFHYFKSVHPLRTNERRTLSLTGSFVFGISVLGATVTAFQMATLGPAAGSSLIFTELISSAMLLFLFFREFNEPMTG